MTPVRFIRMTTMPLLGKRGAVFDDDTSSLHPDDDHAFVGEAWDDSDLQYDESNPDAIVCMQFEESLVEALQCDPDLAACFNTYLDARRRISDKNKNRGFWIPTAYRGGGVS
eukprot:s1032_g16.t1